MLAAWIDATEASRLAASNARQFTPLASMLSTLASSLLVSLTASASTQPFEQNHSPSTVNPSEQSARRYYLSHADEFPGRSFENAREVVEEQLLTLERRGQWAAYVQALESRAVMDWKSRDAQRAYVIGLTERANTQK